MKSIYERIKNNIRPILQLLLLVGVFFAPRIFKITELIKTPPKLEASQKICDYIFYFAWKGGDWAIGVFFLIVVLFIIRKWNKTYMFNRGNYYKQYRYGGIGYVQRYWGTRNVTLFRCRYICNLNWC